MGRSRYWEFGCAFKIEHHPTDPSIKYAVNEFGLSQSNDGGNTWHYLGFSVFDLAFDPDDVKWRYAGGANDFYRSQDGGNTWFKISDAFSGNCGKIIVHPGKIFVGTDIGMYLSKDFGLTFEGYNNGINATWLRSMDLRKTGYSFAACKSGLFNSTDIGASWQKVNDDGEFKKLYFVPSDIKLLLLKANGLFESNDYGTTINKIYDPPAANYLADFKVDPLTGKLFLCENVWDPNINGFRIGLSYSTDFGKNWVEQAKVVTQNPSFGYPVDFDSDSEFYIGGTELKNGKWKAALYKYSSLLGSISDIDSFGSVDSVKDIERGPNSHLMIGTPGGVYRGNLNGSINWEPPPVGFEFDASVVKIHPEIPSIVVSGGKDGFYFSINGATDWTGLNDPIQLRVTDLGFYKDAAQNLVRTTEIDESSKDLFIGTGGGGIIKLDISSVVVYKLTVASGDGGTTDPVPGDYEHNLGEEVTIKAVPNSGYTFWKWTGDVPSGKETTNPVAVIMDAVKSIKANFTQTSGGDGDTGDEGNGCFIATACYGTPMAEEVRVLCEFRDRYLLTHSVGRAFVSFYYKNSPKAADFIKDKENLKMVIRKYLKPFIWSLYKIMK